MTANWLFHGMLYIYALSLLFYFSDFLAKNVRSRRLGTGLLVVVWLIQFGFIIYRMVKLDSVMIFTLLDTLFFISWFMVTFALTMQLIAKLDLLIFLVIFVSFGLLLAGLLSNETVDAAYIQAVTSQELLFVHVFLAVTSYAVFLLGAIFSMIYLFLHHKLKQRQFSQRLSRLPSLAQIDTYIIRIVVIALSLLALSILLGLLLKLWVGEFAMMFDLKVLNSLVIVLVYAYVLVRRVYYHSEGNKLAWMNLGAFLIVIVNYLFTDHFAELQFWIGAE